MKLLLFPLTCIVVLALLAQSGLGTEVIGSFSPSLDNPNQIVYYDSTGTAVCYANGTSYYGQAGTVTQIIGSYYGQYYAGWMNMSSPDAYPAGEQTYHLYYDKSGNSAMYVLYHDFGHTKGEVTARGSYAIGGSIGMLSIIAGVILLATVAGVRLLGSGISEESVSAIVKGTSLVAIWVVFSLAAYSLINSAGDSLVLPTIYFGLTCIYSMGVINQIGHPGDD